jgi:hypothetical protein
MASVLELICPRNITSAGLEGQVKLLQAAAGARRSRMRLLDEGMGGWACRKELFADCRAWIGQVDAIVIELHQPYTVDDLLAALRKARADFEIVSQMNRKSCPVVMLRRTKSRRTKSLH